MPSLKASEQGIATLKQARNRRGWRIDDDRWLLEASKSLQPDVDWHSAEYSDQEIYAPGVSLSTWRRFLRGQPVNTDVFKAFCQVLDIDWEVAIAEPQGQSIEASSKGAIAAEFPSGPVPLHSPFYIERPPNETLACEEITNPGSVIRIQAPHKMGKSSLILRIVAYAQQMGYHTVKLDFRQADAAIFATLDQFLRWFCINITRQLHLKPHLDEYWDTELGSKICCTLYLQSYLLEQLNAPLLLVLNEVNQVFEYPAIAADFLPLLRSWHEEAKHVPFLQNLRLVVVHSTEVYIPLHIEQSPFNVGLPIKLMPLNLHQVQDLAQRHNLDWSESQTQLLINLVGGHPYLLRLAFYYLSHQTITLEQLLQTAPTLAGIYTHHLQERSLLLHQDPKLLEAFSQVIAAKAGIQLAPTLTYKLVSMGLVTLEGNEVVPRCDLYRLYFGRQECAL